MYTKEELIKKIKNLKKRHKQLGTMLDNADPKEVTTDQIEKWSSERDGIGAKIYSLESRLERGEYKT